MTRLPEFDLVSAGTLLYTSTQVAEISWTSIANDDVAQPALAPRFNIKGELLAEVLRRSDVAIEFKRVLEK